MKKMQLKLLMIVLVIFSFTFLLSIGKTKAIYHDVKSTTINLSVVEPPETYTVSFVPNNGGSIPSRSIEPNDPVGVLPIPTKANSNFAGWYDENDQRVRHTTLITRDTTLHAVWTDIVCKRVTDENNLHTETCVSSGGCVAAGITAGNTITYGDVGDGVHSQRHHPFLVSITDAHTGIGLNLEQIGGKGSYRLIGRCESPVSRLCLPHYWQGKTHY